MDKGKNNITKEEPTLWIHSNQQHSRCIQLLHELRHEVLSLAKSVNKTYHR